MIYHLNQFFVLGIKVLTDLDELQAAYCFTAASDVFMIVDRKVCVFYYYFENISVVKAKVNWNNCKNVGIRIQRHHQIDSVLPDCNLMSPSEMENLTQVVRRFGSKLQFMVEKCFVPIEV